MTVTPRRRGPGPCVVSLLRERMAQLQTYFDALLAVPGIDALPEFLAFFRD